MCEGKTRKKIERERSNGTTLYHGTQQVGWCKGGGGVVVAVLMMFVHSFPLHHHLYIDAQTTDVVHNQ